MQRRTFLEGFAAALWKQGPPPSFNAQLLDLMQVAPVPGAVAGALHRGKPAWIQPFGVRNVETKQPVAADTVFQAASLSKQVAAYAAFALRDAGKLDFDRPLVAYLDDLPDPGARLVTARRVLSHTTGFPNWRSEAGQKLVPEFAPGERFQYSGEGYFYLQRVMEEISGRGYGDLIGELVFRPLGMTSSSMTWKPEFAGRYAVPHDRRGSLRSDSKPKAQALDSWKYADSAAAARAAGHPELPNWMLPNAAASLVTTAPDYARFLAAALQNPEIRKAQVRFRPSLAWGLGWGLEQAAGREYLWQWGDNSGYKNFVAAEPATGSAIFVFTNGDSGVRVYDRIVTHATGHDHPALFWI